MIEINLIKVIFSIYGTWGEVLCNIWSIRCVSELIWME